jgi:hypothetical protein
MQRPSIDNLLAQDQPPQAAPAGPEPSGRSFAAHMGRAASQGMSKRSSVSFKALRGHSTSAGAGAGAGAEAAAALTSPLASPRSWYGPPAGTTLAAQKSGRASNIFQTIQKMGGAAAGGGSAPAGALGHSGSGQPGSVKGRSGSPVLRPGEGGKGKGGGMSMMLASGGAGGGAGLQLPPIGGAGAGGAGRISVARPPGQPPLPPPQQQQ